MATDTPVPDDVRRWIDQQPEAEHDALASAWALAGLADLSDPSDPLDARRQAEHADAAWLRLDARLDEAPPARRAPDRGAARSVRTLRRVAVGALLVAAMVALGVLWPRGTTLVAGAEVLVAALPDGSEVTLAPGARLGYRGDLDGDLRRVTLDGQGYFDVATAARPFVVETFNADVEVLGTEFDVSAWDGAPETVVALVEGSVRLRSPAGAVTLDPGEVSRVAGRGAPTPPIRADVATAAAWRSGGFAVVDAPLAGVAAAIAGRFGQPVALAPGVDGARRLTLFLPAADSADAVLRDVAAYLDLRIQSGPDGFTVLPR